jgi:hypothetical protein
MYQKFSLMNASILSAILTISEDTMFQGGLQKHFEMYFHVYNSP